MNRRTHKLIIICILIAIFSFVVSWAMARDNINTENIFQIPSEQVEYSILNTIDEIESFQKTKTIIWIIILSHIISIMWVGFVNMMSLDRDMGRMSYPLIIMPIANIICAIIILEKIKERVKQKKEGE